MGRLRLSTHRKNEKRHKYGFYPIRIPRDTVSVLPISLPLDKQFITLSLPVTTYASLPANTPASLQARISSLGTLPQGDLILLCYFNMIIHFYDTKFKAGLMCPSTLVQ